MKSTAETEVGAEAYLLGDEIISASAKVTGSVAFAGTASINIKFADGDMSIDSSVGTNTEK